MRVAPGPHHYSISCLVMSMMGEFLLEVHRQALEVNCEYASVASSLFHILLRYVNHKSITRGHTARGTPQQWDLVLNNYGLVLTIKEASSNM